MSGWFTFRPIIAIIKKNPIIFGGDDMEYEAKRKLKDIAPLLDRLDRGESMTAEERAEMAAIRSLDGNGWKGELPRSIGDLTALRSLYLNDSQVDDLPQLSGLIALEMLHVSGTRV